MSNNDQSSKELKLTPGEIDGFIQMQLDHYQQILLYYLSRSSNTESLTDIVTALEGIVKLQTASKKAKSLNSKYLVTLTKVKNKLVPQITTQGLKYVKWWKGVRGNVNTIKQIDEAMRKAGVIVNGKT